MRMKKKKLQRFLLPGFLLAGAVYFCFVPFSVFVLKERGQNGAVLLSENLGLSQPLVTRYIHSVEKTPVEDEYYASSGKLWQWEERVRSHNAGLPFLQRPRTRFFQDPFWMHFRGGGVGYSSICLRIGTEEFGRNQLDLPEVFSWNLYALFPGKSVILEVRETSLLLFSLHSFFFRKQRGDAL